VTISVHMHGNLRRFMPGGRDRMVMDVGVATTIEAFLVSLGAEQDTWLVAVNGATASRDHVLVPGDQLDCFEPVAAG
jgi:sulfur carrier protein ThiS